MTTRNLATALTALCLTASASAAVSGPAGTVFENNAHLTATLSNSSPNKIIIDGELITRVTGPEGAYVKDNTPEGALLIAPTGSQNFTIFIDTASGEGVSVDVTPKPGTGKTLRLIPDAPPVKPNPEAKTWEEGQPWEKTLVSVARTVSDGGVPDNYTDTPVSRMPHYSSPAGVTLMPERQLTGSHLRVVRFSMRNTGMVTRSLHEKDFWQKGVRAVMLSTPVLYANGGGFAWVIFSTDGEGR